VLAVSEVWAIQGQPQAQFKFEAASVFKLKLLLLVVVSHSVLHRSRPLPVAVKLSFVSTKMQWESKETELEVLGLELCLVPQYLLVWCQCFWATYKLLELEH